MRHFVNGEARRVAQQLIDLESKSRNGLDASEQASGADERGVSADLVRAYLNGIGRTKLLTAAQEVELAKRIEAGLFAEEVLPEVRDAELAGDLITIAREGRAAKDHLL